MIYFPAGAEFCWQTQAAIRTYADAALLTAYTFVIGDRNIRHLAYILNTLSDRPCIVDSGMFTLQRQIWIDGNITHPDNPVRSSEWMRWYIDRYIAVLQAIDYNGYMVECDCQHLSDNWEDDLAYARERLHAAFGDRVIYVYHPGTEGVATLRQLASDYKRVAISEPAMRVSHKNPAAEIKRLIREAEIDDTRHVHILGTNNFKYMSLPDNFSMDASTWSMIVRFGRAFPNSKFAVYWWRREQLEAPPSVLAQVDEKFEECIRHGLASPLNPKKRRDDEYLRACAAALVAGQQLVRSERKYYAHPPNDTITGGNASWHTDLDGTRARGGTTTQSPGAKKRPAKRGSRRSGARRKPG